jgi:hypothetical protein
LSLRAQWFYIIFKFLCTAKIFERKDFHKYLYFIWLKSSLTLKCSCASQSTTHSLLSYDRRQESEWLCYGAVAEGLIDRVWSKRACQGKHSSSRESDVVFNSIYIADQLKQFSVFCCCFCLFWDKVSLCSLELAISLPLPVSAGITGIWQYTLTSSDF